MTLEFDCSVHASYCPLMADFELLFIDSFWILLPNCDPPTSDALAIPPACRRRHNSRHHHSHSSNLTRSGSSRRAPSDTGAG